MRWATCSENNKNRQTMSANASGYVGVSGYERYKKWRVVYGINQTHKHIGYFRTNEEAARAHDRAALEVDPARCVLNCPIPQAQRDVYISYYQLKTNLAKTRAIIDEFNKL